VVASTNFAEANLVINELLVSVQDILATQLTGTYFFGSLANGDFDRQRDVDIFIQYALEKSR
jgi:predicted nucleotidyltransferase